MTLLAIPTGLTWHAQTTIPDTMSTLEARLDGYGPGHALDSGGTLTVTQTTLAAGRYYFRGAGGSTLGRWERERPAGGRYVLLCTGGQLDTADGWVMWIEGAGAVASPLPSAGPAPTTAPTTTAPAPAAARQGVSSGLLGLAIAVGLLIARKG